MSKQRTKRGWKRLFIHLSFLKREAIIISAKSKYRNVLAKKKQHVTCSKTTPT